MGRLPTRFTKDTYKEVLADPAVGSFTKDIITRGMTMKPVDAAKDVSLALACLEAVLFDDGTS